MKLKIRYEDTYQTIELDAEAEERLWVSLSLEEEELSQEDKEARIQEAWEEQFNRPEYNSWHKFHRHWDFGETSEECYTDALEPLFEQYSYEDICAQVQSALKKKPEWADAFIAARLNGESVREYAARTGADENSISQKLRRAEKKLREKYIRN